MIFIYPAAGIGLVILFILGYALTNRILTRLAHKPDMATRYYRPDGKEINPPFRLTEKAIGTFSVGGGVAALALVIVLVIFIPQSWGIMLLAVLTGLGIVFSLLTFLL